MIKNNQSSYSLILTALGGVLSFAFCFFIWLASLNFSAPPYKPTSVPSNQIEGLAWLNSVSDIQDKFLAADARLADMFANYQYTSAWYVEAEASLQQEDDIADEISKLPHPPPAFRKLDTILREIGTETHAMTYDFRNGIAKLNEVDVEKGTAHVKRLSELWIDFRNEADRLTKTLEE